MDSIFTLFLLFIAAIVGLLTYLTIYNMDATLLMSVSAMALVIGAWWHWTQFSVDYRTSTWQEQLRSYASYVIVFVVILLSYAFYVFGWSGSSIQDYASQAQQAVRDTYTKTVEKARSATSDVLSVGASAFESSSPGSNMRSNMGRASNVGRNSNIGSIGPGLF
jgi:hypothetical protein